MHPNLCIYVLLCVVFIVIIIIIINSVISVFTLKIPKRKKCTSNARKMHLNNRKKKQSMEC